MKAVLEGLLYVQGDLGLTIEQVMDILNISSDEAKNLVYELKSSYESPDRGLRINFLGNTFKLTTKEEHKEYYQKLITTRGTNTLSSSALETLAIIAYNQPITRAEIDEIRGLASINMIRKLMAKDLIKISGKSNLPGKPNLYRTTSEFLDYFGLATISDLPDIPLGKTMDEEQELFTSIYKEEK